MSDHLDLELQTVVSRVIVVRGTEEQQVLLLLSRLFSLSHQVSSKVFL